MESAGSKSESAPVVASVMSLPRLFDAHEMPCMIDMLDVDIQGAEIELFGSEETVHYLSRHVRRVHVGTHYPAWKDGTKGWHDKRGVKIRQLFREHNWTETWVYNPGPYPGRTHPTSRGPVLFGDGIYSALNGNAIEC